jgi:hypothetical protein
MEPLKKQYNHVYHARIPNLIIEQSLDVDATLQALIDRVNELSEILTADKKEMTPESVLDWVNSPKRFKAEGLRVQKWSDYEECAIGYFKSEAEAQAALELLLNL